MRVPAVHHRVAEPVVHERRLAVVLHPADRLHRLDAVQRLLYQLERDLALLDVADVAVVQRVEVRDVHQVLDHAAGSSPAPAPGRTCACAIRRLRAPACAAAPLAELCAGSPGQTQARPSCSTSGNGRSFARVGNRQVELRRDAHAVAGAVIAEAVVGALEHAVGEHPAFRERHALVHAAVVEGASLPSAVRQSSTGRLHRRRPLGSFTGKSCERPATYQAFSTNVFTGIAISYSRGMAACFTSFCHSARSSRLISKSRSGVDPAAA